ncbi:hypothetical protein TSOC_008639 [Tetrabaena socialis]|uniref:Uncharacterized protein n=1 Tax=Tetrabaena socialis TaxID=47790 RepID=A0A2J7ZY00_9CHLO|nr:hypothetical protein TSOC_008639 [Tetrabaena socialis]|eukprot:PNH05137.1 hypothetical protein TSOC_008639 [Tetrabaena socialis]
MPRRILDAVATSTIPSARRAMSRDNSDGVLREALHQMRTLNPSEQWSAHQWWEAFSFLFLAAPSARHALLVAQDDLLWFVTAASALGPASPPVTLRRNTGSELPPELRPGGGGFDGVDWAASVALNLVAQAQYELTVVHCRQDALATVAQGHASPSHAVQPHRNAASAPAVATRRRVFASPMCSEVNLDDAKAGRPPRACYPDVCFAVDNFEEAFQDTILSRPGDCFCVMLHVHAHVDAAASPPSNHPPVGQPASPGGPHPGTGAPAVAHPPAATDAPHPPPHERRAALFSAYVTREQVAEYLAVHAPAVRPPSLLHRLLGVGRDAGRPAGGSGSGARRERVIMRGPGGVGRAEVAAAAVPVVGTGGAPGVGGDAAGGAAALQLSLMWMSLPAPALAQAVLRFACGEA